jgi:hypothetical protein
LGKDVPELMEGVTNYLAIYALKERVDNDMIDRIQIYPAQTKMVKQIMDLGIDPKLLAKAFFQGDEAFGKDVNAKIGHATAWAVLLSCFGSELAIPYEEFPRVASGNISKAQIFEYLVTQEMKIETENGVNRLVRR